jgi:hypothetical protein
MFTFKKQDKNPLFYIDDKPVYTVFKKDSKLRIRPFRDSKKYLDSDEFRERYNLTRKESTELKKAIRSDIVPENNLKGKFYHIRRDLNQRLFTEIDLRGTDHKITWRFPDNVKEWPGTSIIIGSSNSGKTYKILSEIEEALRRPKKRKFVYVSPELNVDTTLKKILNNKRWINYFQGVDVSDDAFKESEKATPDEWWHDSIKPILLEQNPGTCIVLDDAPDSPIHKYLQKFLIKYLRTGRHKKIGVSSIQHNVRGGKWTSQSFSSVKFVSLFVRGSGKGKMVEFLYETLGVGRKKARILVDIFGESGRSMTIHQWSPTIIFGDKYAVWV